MCMAVPSGRKLTNFDIKLLKEAHRCGSIAYSDRPFKLKPRADGSQIESHVYVSLRGELTDGAYLLSLVGEKTAEIVRENILPDDKQPNLIGLPTAGTAIAIAASQASVALHVKDQRFPLIACRVMREKLKLAHGANNRWVNGELGGQPPDLKKFTFWTVDNVVTDGKTKFEYADFLEQDGYKP